jgi:hypothetical protein
MNHKQREVILELNRLMSEAAPVPPAPPANYGKKTVDPVLLAQYKADTGVYLAQLKHHLGPGSDQFRLQAGLVRCDAESGWRFADGH